MVLEALKNLYRDSAFLNETALQLEFAIQVLKLNFQGYDFNCYPEYSFKSNSKRCELDLLIHDNKDNTFTIIEFKYKTANSKKENKKLKIETILNQQLSLTNQLAHDLARFDTFSDLERTELLVKNNSEISNGFIIFLTNDFNYWLPVNKSITYKYGTDFRLYDKRLIKASSLLSWKPINGVTLNINSIGKERNRSIHLIDEYELNWVPFNKLNESFAYNEFKSLIIKVNK